MEFEYLKNRFVSDKVLDTGDAVYNIVRISFYYSLYLVFSIVRGAASGIIDSWKDAGF